MASPALHVDVTRKPKTTPQHPLDLPSSVCLEVNPVGKPDAVAAHAWFDERGWETGPRATALILDSTTA